MTSAVSAFGHKSEFDPFLYAPVGEERNGMLLSVLSALARLDVDPWQEAAALTKMPAQDATAAIDIVAFVHAIRCGDPAGAEYDRFV